LYNPTPNATWTVYFQTKRSAGSFDGTYVGVSNGCYQTVEILQGLYRSYNIGCASSPQAFMGPIDSNATNFDVTYAFSSVPGLKGSRISYGYTFSSAVEPAILNITGGLIGSATLTLKRVFVAPGAIVCNVTLDTPFSQFDAASQQSFLNALGAQLGVSPSNLLVIGKRAGSVILEIVVQDDQQAGKTADTQLSVLRTLGSVDGYTITSVTVPTTNPSGASTTIVNTLGAALLALVCTIVLTTHQ